MTTPQRVKNHRERAASRGVRRVEVTVRESDAPVIRRAAEILRQQGEAAEALRQIVRNQSAAGPTALDVYRDLQTLIPEGEPLDFGRDTLPPDRDFAF